MKYSGQINDLAAFSTDYPSYTNISFSLSFVKRKLRPIVYQSHSQCIIVTFQEASSFANIL